MAPSTFLNRYQQEGEFPVGQGTYGVVYKARDLVRFAFAHPPGRRTGRGRHTDRSGGSDRSGGGHFDPQVTGRTVAVKVLPQEKINTKKLEESLNSEIMVLKNIEHDHIVRLFDVQVCGPSTLHVSEEQRLTRERTARPPWQGTRYSEHRPRRTW